MGNKGLVQSIRYTARSYLMCTCLVSMAGISIAQVQLTWIYPGVQDAPVYATSPITITFDTDIHGLAEGDTAYYNFVFRMVDPDWNEIVGEATVTTMPYETTFVNPFDEEVTVFYDLWVNVNNEGQDIFPDGEPNPSAWYILLSPSTNSTQRSIVFVKHGRGYGDRAQVFSLTGRMISHPAVPDRRDLRRLPATMYIFGHPSSKAVKKSAF
ncbi:MAG: hypothetical protein GF350_12160 [Chitinivibrionales bacterium]|nr:hypothetical protein [Chitinivibrionales bacterium]